MRSATDYVSVGRVTRRLVGLLVLLALAVPCGLSGCSDGIGTGTLSVLITDSPYPFEHIAEAWVTVTRIEVHYVGDDDDEETESADDEESEELEDDAAEGDEGEDDAEEQDDAEKDSPWFVVFEGEQEFNLLTLRNGRTDLLGTAELPAGRYNQTRLIVTAGRVVLTDGREFELVVPSGEQTGIKLHYPFEVGTDRAETTLLLDVNLSRAFQPVPGSGITDASDIEEFHFAPSLAMRIIDLLEAGSIAGAVTDAEGNPLEATTVTATVEGEEVTSTMTEPDGTYQLTGLPTGTYTVSFSATGFTGSETTGVEVQAGETTDGVNAELAATGG